MPAWLIAALPAVLATIAGVLTTALLIGPFVLPLYLRKVKREDRERLLAATKGAYLVVSQIASRTPTDLDDSLAKVIKMVEDEVGKSLSDDDKKLVSNVAKAMHADPTKPNL